MQLKPEQLLTRCDPTELGFALTDEIEPRPAGVGQERALSAIRFGLGMKDAGFNLFVLGPSGSGRRGLVHAFVEQRAATERVPDDFCYVHNFDDERRPRALRLPAGQGARLRDHMERIIEELPTAVTLAFDNPRYREQREAIEKDVEGRHQREITEIVKQAAGRDVAVMHTPEGIALAPMRGGTVLDPAAREKLSDEEQKRFEREAELVQEQLQAALRHIPQLQHEQRDRVRSLDRGITEAVIRELLVEARRALADLEEVLTYLAQVEQDILSKAAPALRGFARHEASSPLQSNPGALQDSVLYRYRVNLISDHRASVGAPVVYCDHPTSGNLVGKVEHLSSLGVLVTNFTLIRSGALHAANGGYLIVDARHLLLQPVSWEQLKRSLRSGEIRIESVAEALDLSAGMSLEPEPIPFRGKVVLIGEPWLYHQLAARDPDFEELFKVAADFESDVARTATTSRAYAELLAQVAHRDELPVLEAPAVARLIEHASRLAEDSTRLSLHLRSVCDLMREAAYWSREAEATRLEASHVERALAERQRRHGRLRERHQAAICDGTLLVDTTGAEIGQVNGLSVVQLGEASFGSPARITACVRLGRGEVVDIQREVQLGGPIHSKGVLTLSACLGSRYCMNKPLSLRATLVFEQAYGPVEGDSASLAELLALLSAIGKIPLAQSIAVTGSIDQHGRVQAVGGVNDKIEGFFEVCRARWLDGSHGVIVPAANAKHLMLRQDVVAAVAEGKFHVWTVADVDEAAEIVLGMPAGVRLADGGYPEDTVNRRVEDGLAVLASAALDAARAAQPNPDR